ncbi:Phospholipid N-methyltransferase [Thermoactinomyces sp. DSM 45891]|uniref:class I SAM-dependent methyltransferase n=1 Tax=Thermoactinomyces sp. DSM 45891 TaxID=1761907 RepID=UPI00090F9DBD|nr:methyltransferase [Thermoactinomyces sp. DSM 45891]SFX19826.1 Phospholipid N-methyltransferase [Thermoactinomyces sp. DSM 45891]
MILERAKFIHKFVQSPREIGSITPSSRFLAHAMLKDIDWNQTKTIIELGAGTGVFTREIARKASSPTKALIFEQDDDLRKDLEEKIPQFTYLKKAEELNNTLKELHIPNVDAIISGLPFSNFSQSFTQEILDQIQSSLSKNGSFITYQYSLQLRKELKNRFKNVQIDFVPWNLPPTFVYICTN